MKKLIVLFCITFVCLGNAEVNNVLTERHAKKMADAQYDMFVAAAPSAHYRVATSNVADPFSAKTNKYAETKILSFIGEKPFLVKFSSDGASISAVTSAEYYIPANTREYMAVDASYPYVRLLNTDSSASAIYITEIK
jgi:hypothetical protein